MATFGNYFPAVQIQYQRLQNETYELLAKKHQLETELYELNNTMGSSFNMLKSIQIRCKHYLASNIMAHFIIQSVISH